MSGEIIGQRVLAVMRRLEARDAEERARAAPRVERLRQISPEVGRFLHTLVLGAKPRTIVEIGTSGGYSALWLATAARRVGARVTTLEVELARATLAEGGLGDVAAVAAGDASGWLRARREPVDFVFLDAEKEDYLVFYELVAPLLSVGGMLVADNLLSHEAELASFRERALSDERFSALVVPVGRGELLAVKVSG